MSPGVVENVKGQPQLLANGRRLAVVLVRIDDARRRWP